MSSYIEGSNFYSLLFSETDLELPAMKYKKMTRIDFFVYV
ncbi:unnamed protein product [Larinioides sclopetarius]|uniref:Maturase K n=1 Tax=Larinioides sclopetarius TaxID=280406 RepID=A0AAV1YP90_9ARAC